MNENMQKGRKNKMLTWIKKKIRQATITCIMAKPPSIMKRDIPLQWTVRRGLSARGSASNPFLNSQVRWQPAGRPFNFTAPSEFLIGIYVYKFWNRGWRRTGLQSGDVRTVQSSSPHNIARSKDNFLNFAVSPAGSLVKGSKWDSRGWWGRFWEGAGKG